ncbi:hypothetical protein J6590_006461 [Homalodisca vitripennis]|nr:hypothetical protein J6590_006461 [Homalodisca vitripennis]
MRSLHRVGKSDTHVTNVISVLQHQFKSLHRISKSDTHATNVTSVLQHHLRSLHRVSKSDVHATTVISVLQHQFRSLHRVSKSDTHATNVTSVLQHHLRSFTPIITVLYDVNSLYRSPPRQQVQETYIAKLPTRQLNEEVCLYYTNSAPHVSLFHYKLLAHTTMIQPFCLIAALNLPITYLVSFIRLIQGEKPTDNMRR